MPSKRVGIAGSMGGRMGSWNLHALVESYSGVRRDLLEGKNIARKSAFISIESFLYGIKDLRGFIYLRLVSSRKVFAQIQQENLRKDMYLQILLKKASTLVLKLNSVVNIQKMKRIINGKGKKLDTLLRTAGYKEIMEERKLARIVHNQYLDSIALASHPVMSGLTRIK